MQNSSVAKIRNVIARPSMFLLGNDLSYAVAFLSGLNYSSETKPLDGFHDWLVENHFDEPQAQSWEALVNKIPSCSTGKPQSDAHTFLYMVAEFLDASEGV